MGSLLSKGQKAPSQSLVSVGMLAWNTFFVDSFILIFLCVWKVIL